MSEASRREYLRAIYRRYHTASVEQKGRILDEFTAACGYNRKYAIRLLNAPLDPPARPPKRPVGEAVRAEWWKHSVTRATLRRGGIRWDHRPGGRDSDARSPSINMPVRTKQAGIGERLSDPSFVFIRSDVPF